MLPAHKNAPEWCELLDVIYGHCSAQHASHQQCIGVPQKKVGSFSKAPLYWRSAHTSIYSFNNNRGQWGEKKKKEREGKRPAGRCADISRRCRWGRRRWGPLFGKGRRTGVRHCLEEIPLCWSVRAASLPGDRAHTDKQRRHKRLFPFRPSSYYHSTTKTICH